MKERKGIAVSEGIAIAKAMVMDSDEYQIPRRVVGNDLRLAEVERVNEAFESAVSELLQLEEGSHEFSQKAIRDIYAVHQRFLQDETLRSKIIDMVCEECITAEYAVASVLEQTRDTFRKSQDRYISDRASDIIDIEKRILKHLIELKESSIDHIASSIVVVAKDLRPTQIAKFDTKYVMGVACDTGGKTSHAAIIAKAMGIPTVFALEDLTSIVKRGDMVIIDANQGKVVVNPDEETLRQYRQLSENFQRSLQKLEPIKYEPAMTKDGARITMLANIEFAHEVEQVLDMHADGIGLFRTEFLYLKTGMEPSENDHFDAYSHVASALKDKPLVIRTMDMGADKFTQSHRFTPEINPSLGLRSIRFSLKNLDMFKTQLRAIYRASEFGNIKIMLPLVTSVRELMEVQRVLSEVCKQLENEGVPFNYEMPLGIMIETPSAALTAQTLAKHVEFFSIGTNDLTQYVLAVDRGNAQVSDMFSSAEPAVLHLIKNVIEQAKASNIDVSICGEMAANPRYVMLLLGMGIRSLSITPSMILEIKNLIRAVTTGQCEEIAARVLGMESEEEITGYLIEETREIFPLCF
jgi:phosphotransferase system enzyme I (PtsI)